MVVLVILVGLVVAVVAVRILRRRQRQAPSIDLTQLLAQQRLRALEQMTLRAMVEAEAESPRRVVCLQEIERR